MKICLYSPYVPEHTGGGEKYFFDVARILSTRHQVSIAVSSLQPIGTDLEYTLRQRYETFLGQPLTEIQFIDSPLGTSLSAWQKLHWTAQFDVMYYITDGSLFFSRAGKNILHIQVPLRLKKSGLIEQLKLLNWQMKNTNSNFTKLVVEKSWPVKIDEVHQPLIELPQYSSEAQPKKEHIILHVGRFFRQLHSKRQDVIIELFKQLQAADSRATKNWKLVMIGTVEDQEYAAEVKKLAAGLPVQILHDITREELVTWYYRASIYWHATGFGVDQTKEPEKVEHFGISTAEAMLAGCAPVVIGKGGQPEVLGSELEPWLWQTEAEAVSKTLELICDPKLLKEVQATAKNRAQVFDRTHFENTLWKMIGR